VARSSVNNRDRYVALHFSKEGALVRTSHGCLEPPAAT
jgi:hypothetical protein